MKTITSIAVVSQKGGVGKTTVAFNLAKKLAKGRKNRVLIVDNDPQGNLTEAILGSERELTAHLLKVYQETPVIPQCVDRNLFLIGANIHLAQVGEMDFEVIYRLKEQLAQINLETGPFSHVVIDCSPSFGYMLMAALYAANSVLVVSQPAHWALSGIRSVFETVEKTKRRLNPKLHVLGILLNQVEGRKLVIQQQTEQVLRTACGKEVFTATLGKRVDFAESAARGELIGDYAPDSAAGKEFTRFYKELSNRLNKRVMHNEK